MGPTTLLLPTRKTTSSPGSLLTVESNHFCVLKSRGAILNVYETGQYPIEPRNLCCSGRSSRPSTAARARGSMRRSSINRSKLPWSRPPELALTEGDGGDELRRGLLYPMSTPKKMRSSWCSICRMPAMSWIPRRSTKYAGPVVEQAINQFVNR